MQFRTYITLTSVALALLLSGCLDMEVDNPNAPDAEQALNTPGDIESLAGDQFLQWWNGTQKSYPGYTMAVMGQELTSSYGNFGKFDLGRQPREQFINTPTYDYRDMVDTPWSNIYAAINSSIEVLNQMDDPDFSLDSEQDETRMEMFVTFVKGLSYNSLANQFDRTILVDSDDELIDEDGQPVIFDPPSEPNYEEALDFGLEKLADAQEMAEANPDIMIPGDWLLMESDMDMDGFVQLINSYRARMIPANTRTPDERDDLDWGQIIEYAENGYPGDVIMEADGSLQWSFSVNLYNEALWHRVNYELIGRTDQSGNFEGWLDTDLLDRTAVVLDTEDERIADTEEDVAEADNPYVQFAGPAPHPPNRGTYFHSNYATQRNLDTYWAGLIGPMPHIYRTEIDMIIAEGMLRTEGESSEVADMINETRVDNGGLEPVEEGDGYDELFNAMRYELEMETLGSSAGIAYYNKRGWGDLKGDYDYGGLPDGTPLHFPIPAEELEGVLQMDPYTFGGQDDDDWGAGAQANDRAAGINTDRIIEAMRAAHEKEPDIIK